MADPIPEEYQKLIATLQEMDIKPKADNPGDFESWIKQYAMEKLGTTVKKEPQTVATSNQPLRLNNFSGSTGGKDKKGETSYELWRYEIMGLLQDKIHKEETIVQAIRRSVRGEAGLIAMRLGPEASLVEIMTKMESVFGNVDEVETIMSDFYNARQQEDEDVSAWSCRLEGILDKAISANKVTREQAGTMLHDMLWKGLKPALKDVSHYEKVRYDTFDKLRTGLRRIEKEHQLDHPSSKIKATSKQAVVTEESDQAGLSGILKQIDTRLQNLESQQGNRYQHPQQQHQQGLQQQQQYQQRGYQPQRYQYQQGYQQQQQRYQPQQYQYQQRYDANRGRGQGRYRGRGYNRGYRGLAGQQQQRPSNFQFPPVTCNRCGREGHLVKGCRFNTDVDGKPLNF